MENLVNKNGLFFIELLFFFYEISKLCEFDRVKLSLGDSIKGEEDE